MYTFVLHTRARARARAHTHTHTHIHPYKTYTRDTYTIVIIIVVDARSSPLPPPSLYYLVTLVIVLIVDDRRGRFSRHFLLRSCSSPFFFSFISRLNARKERTWRRIGWTRGRFPRDSRKSISRRLPANARAETRS